MKYDGEMDSRGPSDFSGNAAPAEDEADEEDIDEDADDILLSSSMRGGAGSKRHGDGKTVKSDRVGSSVSIHLFHPSRMKHKI